MDRDINQTQYNGMEIAVVGMSGRFPGSHSLDQFWSNLIEGKESITFFTKEELLQKGISEKTLDNKNYVKAASVLEQMDYFDNDLFDYTSKEAGLMDPQYRILHECTWEALEDAGYDPEKTSELIGVYMGSSNNIYWLANQLGRIKNSSEQYTAMLLNDQSFVTRLSYKFNLKGPSVAIQTACSTSLVSIHLACQGLLNGDTDIALAGGVSISLANESGYLYQEGMIYSPDGHCRAFDEKAHGTVFGSGAGVVVLKRLQDAIESGDHIYALIKGSAVNNDGKNKVGYTAPSALGQSEVIKSALDMAEVQPETITYIEAHGTGTEIGDPIEMDALKSAFNTDKRNYCGIGSLKTNIGHLDAAAGVAGFIKTVLALKNKQIPPSLNFDKPNHKIDFDNSPFYVNEKLTDWKKSLYPLRAGVSSFGIGGTNAHVILEEAPITDDHPISLLEKDQLFVLSAKSEKALDQSTENLKMYMIKHPDMNVASIAHTLKVGRKSLPYRRTFVSSSVEDAIEMIANRDELSFMKSIEVASRPPVIFMMTGNGYSPEIGLALYRQLPSFQEEVDRVFTCIRPHGYMDCISFLQEEGHTASFMLIIEYCIAKLLLKYGLQAEMIVGYGAGNDIAMCLRNEISEEELFQLFITKTSESLQQSSVTDNKLKQFIEHNKTGIIIEIGDEDPGNSVINESVRKQFVISPITSQGKTSVMRTLQQTMGELWKRGGEINWEMLLGSEQPKRIPLPTYPFQRQEFRHDKLTMFSSLSKQEQEIEQLIVTTGDHRDIAQMEEAILDIIQGYFGIEEVGLHENFFDIGATSFDISQLAFKLSESLGIEVPLLSLYTFTTVSELARNIFSVTVEDTLETATTQELSYNYGNQSEHIEIAVIGMSGKFPGSKDLKQYWDNLISGKEMITHFTDEELANSGIDEETIHHPNYIKSKGILEGDMDEFDASFFNYSHREAAIMDPQLRIFHECAWEALESAGYDPNEYGGRIGVFAGTSPNHPWISQFTDQISDAEKLSTMLLNDREFFSTMISYKLNLKGPSITMQTACSTSLVNIIIACQGLVAQTCDIALAGGVTISYPYKNGYFHQEGMIYSSDGHCKPFDEHADGTVFGDGAGVVVLKRLNDALNDGDTILAVIKGHGLNNDGGEKIGYTAPSIQGQREVIRSAHRMAGVHPESISFVEAHGTGTSVGDPIEFEALKQAFNTDKKGFCMLGSVKSNVGHLNAAAGVAGFIKTVLALKHKELPPSLNYRNPNPKIDFENSPFYMNTTLAKLERNLQPIRAGISSFGIGGTNTHVILEEAPRVDQGGGSTQEDKARLIVLSANSEDALSQMKENLSQYFIDNPDTNLADAAYTLQVGRKKCKHRLATVCTSIEDWNGNINNPKNDIIHTSVANEKQQSTIFMFSGQGAQYVNMGLELYEKEPFFRSEIDRCFELIRPYVDVDLKSIIFPNTETEASQMLIKNTKYAQPLLFILEYSLSKLLMRWGIHPVAMIGHSIGEYTAACLSGVIRLEDALHLVALRGAMIQKLPSGSMLSVSMSEAELSPYLVEDISLAAINSSHMCVISGAHDTIDKLQHEFERLGKLTTRLQTSHAFHSHMMDPILGEFQEVVESINLSPPQKPFISNLSGTWITNEEAVDPTYWVKHLRSTVQFADGIQKLMEKEEAIFLEVGPGKSLSTLVSMHEERKNGHKVINTMRNIHQKKVSDAQNLLHTIAKLWTVGVAIDWNSVNAEEKRHRIELPSYPFQRQRYRIEPSLEVKNTDNIRKKDEQFSKQNKRRMDDWFYYPTWNRSHLTTVPDHETTKSKYLVFHDELNICNKLIKKLEQNYELVTVSIGDEFTRIGHNHYIINPEEYENYEQLIHDLKRSGNFPSRILHMWNISEDQSNKAISEDDFESNFKKVQVRGYYSLIFLSQAMNKQNISSHIDLKIITNNTLEVTGNELILPEKSTILGPCKVIPQEYGNITCQCIDIQITQKESREETKLIDWLTSEMNTETKDRMIAYRGNYRWVQNLATIQLSESSQQTIKLRKNGVYLIAGGIGGIGLTLAEYIANNTNAKIILTARSHFPERDMWGNYIEQHGENDAISRKIRRIESIESNHCEVLILKADIANAIEMKNVMDEIINQFGTIHGVIHAAGLPGTSTYCSIEDMKHSFDEEQFDAKVFGIEILTNLIRNKTDIDFCMLFSSIASVLGGLGYTAYTAANIYMDVYAQQQNQNSSFPWVAVNWDSWKFWDEQSSNVGESLAELAILPSEGNDLFHRLLSSEIPNQLCVSTGNLQERMDQWINIHQHLERELETLEDRQKTDLLTLHEDEIKVMASKIFFNYFGKEDIETHDNLFELGATSLDMIQLSTRLSQQFNVSIPVVKLFTYPTIDLITNHLCELSQMARNDAEYAGTQIIEMTQESVHKRKEKQTNQRNKRLQRSEFD